MKIKTEKRQMAGNKNIFIKNSRLLNAYKTNSQNNCVKISSVKFLLI